MYGVAKIMKEETAQFIAQTDGYAAREDSWKSSSQSNSSTPKQTPKYCMVYSSCASDESDITSGDGEVNGKKSQMAMTSGPKPLSIQWVARA